MAHMSRREYRMKKGHSQAGADQSRINYSRSKVNSREKFRSRKISNPQPIDHANVARASRENTSRENYHLDDFLGPSLCFRSDHRFSPILHYD